MKKLVFIVALMFSIINCSEDQIENQQLTVKTNKSHYVNGEMIGFTISNHNTASAHIANCCSSVAYFIDKNENGSWNEHSNFGLPCLALCPGIDLKLNYLQSIDNSFSLNETGIFRIRIPYSFNSDQIWDSEIISNSFTID